MPGIFHIFQTNHTVGPTEQILLVGDPGDPHLDISMAAILISLQVMLGKRPPCFAELLISATMIASYSGRSFKVLK